MRGKKEIRLGTPEINKCIIEFETTTAWLSKLDETKTSRLEEFGREVVTTRYYNISNNCYSIKIYRDTLHAEFYYQKNANDTELSLFAKEKFSLGKDELYQILMKNSSLMVPNQLGLFSTSGGASGKGVETNMKYMNDAVDMEH